MKVTAIKYIAFILFFANIAMAQVFNRLEYSKVDVIQSRMNATLLISVFSKKGKHLSTGAGFFIGKNGLFVTNKHVVKHLLKDRTTQLQVRTIDNRYITEIEQGKCGDQVSKIDLCVFRATKFKVKNYFQKKAVRYGENNQLYSIGHCPKDGEWNIKNGTTNKVYKDINEITSLDDLDINRKIETLQVSVAFCGGDSGGPVFSPRGELLGVTTVSNRDVTKNKTFYMTTTSKEVVKHIKRSTTWTPLDKSRIKGLDKILKMRIEKAEVEKERLKLEKLIKRRGIKRKTK